MQLRIYTPQNFKVNSASNRTDKIHSEYISCNTGTVGNLQANTLNVSHLSTVGPFIFSNSLQSTSPTTGALVISGGAGVANDVVVGGTFNNLLTNKLQLTPTFDVYGDSFTAVPPLSDSWCGVLATMLGKTADNRMSAGGTGVTEACKRMLYSPQNPGFFPNSKLVLIGYNNVRDMTITDEQLSRLQDAYMYLYIINSMPGADTPNMTFMQDGKPVYTGSWQNMAYAGAWGRYTNIAGATVTWTAPNTRYIFVGGVAASDLNTYNNPVTIDGVAYSPISTCSFSSSGDEPTIKANVSVYDCGIIGNHTITITKSAETTGYLWILWICCWKPGDTPLNNVIIGGCINRGWLPDADGTTAGQNGSFKRMNIINTACKNACAYLQNIGMTNIRYVDVSTNQLGNFLLGERVHPSRLPDGGSEWIARQFAKVCY